MNLAQRWSWHPLVFILPVALVVRLIYLGDQSLWLDEALTMLFTRFSWVELWTVVPNHEPHPVFYYSLLKAWSALLQSESEAALRALSVVFSMATVVTGFFLARRLAGDSTGTAAGTVTALLLAVGTTHVWYAQEARAYALFQLAYALLLLGLLRLMQAREGAATPFWRRRAGGDPAHRPEHWAWWLVIGSGAALLWTHNIAPIYVAALSPALLYWVASAGEARRGILLNGAIASAVVLALWGAWIPYLVLHAFVIQHDFWADPLTFAWFAGVMEQVLNGRVRLPFPIVLGLLWFAIAMTGAVTVAQRSRAAAVLFCCAALFPVALVTLAAMIGENILIMRVLVPVTIPFTVLVGVAAARLYRSVPYGAVALVAFFVLSQAVALRGYYSNELRKEAWRPLTAYLAEHHHPSEPIFLMSNYVEVPLRYYVEQIFDYEPQLVGLPSQYQFGITELVRSEHRDVVRERLADEPAFWVVLRSRRQEGDRDGVLPSVLAELDVVETHYERLNRLEVHRYAVVDVVSAIPAPE